MYTIAYTERSLTEASCNGSIVQYGFRPHIDRPKHLKQACVLMNRPLFLGVDVGCTQEDIRQQYASSQKRSDLMPFDMRFSFAQLMPILLELYTIAASYPLVSTCFSGFFLCALDA